MSEIVANSDVTMGHWHGDRKSQTVNKEPESPADASDANCPATVEKRTLTDIEVAARLGVSRFTVRSWRLKGVGPRFLKMGRAVRYRPEDVQEYEQRVLVNPASR
jgi:predicted DNA-binding transcriptional regulator AlpA